jgi:hypothetical protein
MKDETIVKLTWAILVSPAFLFLFFLLWLGAKWDIPPFQLGFMGIGFMLVGVWAHACGLGRTTMLVVKKHLPDRRKHNERNNLS